MSRVTFSFSISPLFCPRHVYTCIRAYIHTSLFNNAGYENWQDQSPDMDLANYSQLNIVALSKDINLGEQDINLCYLCFVEAWWPHG